jgi:hypothetical protein
MAKDSLGTHQGPAFTTLSVLFRVLRAKTGWRHKQWQDSFISGQTCHRPRWIVLTEHPSRPSTLNRRRQTATMVQHLGAKSSTSRRAPQECLGQNGKRAALNRLFQEQGTSGQPSRINAETVRHGERSRGGCQTTIRPLGTGRSVASRCDAPAEPDLRRVQEMTKAQRFRRHFDARPPRPADCLRTRQAPADCQTCGNALVTIRHTPMRLPGSHCSNCCPCCMAERLCARRDRHQKEGQGSPADLGLDSAGKSK